MKKLTADDINRRLEEAHARHPKARDWLMGPRCSLMEYIHASAKKKAKWDAERVFAREEYEKVVEEIRAETAALVAKEDDP